MKEYKTHLTFILHWVSVLSCLAGVNFNQQVNADILEISLADT